MIFSDEETGFSFVKDSMLLVAQETIEVNECVRYGE